MESPLQQLNESLIAIPFINFFHRYWWIFIVIIIFFAIVTPLVKTKRKKESTQSGGYKSGEVLPYHQKGSILTDAELIFYKDLVKAINGKATICPKVRLIDFLLIPPNTNNYKRYKNMIISRHVDFLICDKNSMYPLCVIELDDSSHNMPKNKASDEFKNDAFDKAGIKIHRVNVAHSYNVEKMANIMHPLIEKHQKQDWSS